MARLKDIRNFRNFNIVGVHFINHVIHDENFHWFVILVVECLIKPQDEYDYIDCRVEKLGRCLPDYSSATPISFFNPG